MLGVRCVICNEGRKYFSRFLIQTIDKSAFNPEEGFTDISDWRITRPRSHSVIQTRELKNGVLFNSDFAIKVRLF